MELEMTMYAQRICVHTFAKTVQTALLLLVLRGTGMLRAGVVLELG